MDPLSTDAFRNRPPASISNAPLNWEQRLKEGFETVFIQDESLFVFGEGLDLSSKENIQGLVLAAANRGCREIRFIECDFASVPFDVWNKFIEDLNAQNCICHINLLPFTLDQYRLEALAGVRSLQELSLNEVPEAKFKELCAGLVKFKGSSLQSLTIANSKMTDVRLADLCLALREGPSLTSLSLEGNKLEMKENVAELLACQPKLQSLGLKQNPINPSKTIRQALSASSMLNLIDLSETKLSRPVLEDFLGTIFESFEEVQQVRSNSQKLEVTLLGADEQDHDLLQNIDKMVSENWPNLFHLHFHSGGEIVEESSEGEDDDEEEQEFTVQTLLSNNEVNNAEWYQAQWEIILNDDMQAEIILENEGCIIYGREVTPTSEFAVKGLFAALKNTDCHTLTFAQFNFVQTPPRIWRALVTAIAGSKRLKHLHFTECTIAAQQMDVLTKRIKHLRTLFFNGGSFTPEMYPMLANLQQTPLRILGIKHCQIRDKELPQLLEAIKTIGSLQTLNLSYNELTRASLKALNAFLTQSPLSNLLLDGNSALDNDAELDINTPLSFLQISSHLRHLSTKAILFSADGANKNKDLSRLIDLPESLKAKFREKRNGVPLKWSISYLNKEVAPIFKDQLANQQKLINAQLQGLLVLDISYVLDEEEKSFFDSLNDALVSRNGFSEWLADAFTMEQTLPGPEALSDVLALAAFGLPNRETIAAKFTELLSSRRAPANSLMEQEMAFLSLFADSLKSVGFQVEVHVFDSNHLPRSVNFTLESHPERIFGRDTTFISIPRIYLLRESAPNDIHTLVYSLLRPTEKTARILQTCFFKPYPIINYAAVPAPTEQSILAWIKNPDILPDQILEVFRTQSCYTRISDQLFEPFLSRFFEFKKIAGDGSCVYNAFVDAFSRIPGAEVLFQNPADLRNQLVDHMLLEDNKLLFRSGIEQELLPPLTSEEQALPLDDEAQFNLRYLKYCEKMRTDDWGGYVEICAIASLLTLKGIGIRIHILDRNYIPIGMQDELPLTNANLIIGSGAHQIYLYRRNEDIRLPEGSLQLYHYDILIPRRQNPHPHANGDVAESPPSTPRLSMKHSFESEGEQTGLEGFAVPLAKKARLSNGSQGEQNGGSGQI